MSGWSPALRIARREMLRHKGRSLLVLLLVLLPVTAVAGLSTLLRTSDIDVRESLPLELGAATARLDIGTSRVEQDPTTRSVAQYDAVTPAGVQDLLAVLPEGSRLLPAVVSFDPVRLEVDDRRRRVGVVAVDLSDASLDGPFRVLAGVPPRAPDEIAVSPDLVQAGVEVGSSVVVDGAPRRVTGVVQGPRDLSYGENVFGVAAAVGITQNPNRYWVTGTEVTWADVQELNLLGVTALSRSVVLDPPPASQVPEPPFTDDSRQVTVAIVGLIAVMAVLQVVLLAGPAFAAGARRQRRSLALLAAGGAAPSQVRRVVLAQGLLVGLVSAGVGVPLGVALAAVARAPLTRVAGAQWGPFDVAPLDLVLVALLGAGTALLAALLPAWVMARQPLVAALQGRRLTPAGARRPAQAGLVLLVVGLAVILSSLQGSPFGFAELGIAAGAVPTVLGAVLLAPAALGLVGRVSGRLPLPLRFAARDADRQRGRTAPAVAAITAVVAAVVALATAASSDQAENRLRYSPSGPPGVAVVTAYEQDVDLSVVEGLAREELPDEPVRTLRGVRLPTGPTTGYLSVEVCRPGEAASDGRCFGLVSSYSSSLGSDVLVGDEGLSALGELVPPARLRQAQLALQRGAVLLAVTPGTPPDGRALAEQVELRLTRFTPTPEGPERSRVERTLDVEVEPVLLDSEIAPFKAVVPDEVGQQLGAVPVGLLVGDDLSRGQQSRLTSTLRAYDQAVGVTVERGYEDTGDRTVLLVLSLVAGVLVLAGTLAATSLALTEARPDLVTLGQVGARPRTRRLVAASYALVLGVVGAGLGVAAGLVPGIAAAVPLTRGYSGTTVGEPVVDVPWSVLALVLVVLPLLSAAVAAVSARGRLDAPRRAVA